MKRKVIHAEDQEAGIAEAIVKDETALSSPARTIQEEVPEKGGKNVDVGEDEASYGADRHTLDERT